jgi:hypothetical protein
MQLSLFPSLPLSLPLTGEPGAHTLFTGQREIEKKRREREREKEGEREKEEEKER